MLDERNMAAAKNYEPQVDEEVVEKIAALCHEANAT